MRKRSLIVLSTVMFVSGWIAANAQKPAPGGYVLERDSEIAATEPGTHNGGGQTVGYSFFKKVPKLALVFRKRALKPGPASATTSRRKMRSTTCSAATGP
jgi:hypothetical protein